MASYIGVTPPQETGIVNRFQFTASGGQTVFTGTDNNEADAYVLYKLGQYHYNKGHIATSYQQEVMGKVEWETV